MKIFVILKYDFNKLQQKLWNERLAYTGRLSYIKILSINANNTYILAASIQFWSSTLRVFSTPIIWNLATTPLYKIHSLTK